MAPRSEGSVNRRELVEAQLLQHAASLFAYKGFGATSLEDIAHQAGMKRPSLYHYFRSKDDILSLIVADVVERGPGVVGTLASEDWEPPRKLHAMARALCLEVARSTSGFRLVLTSEANLPGALADRLRESKRAVTHEITNVISEGMRRGDFRPVDSRLAALGILGMCNWIAWWFTPGPDAPAEPVADAIADQAVRSVLRKDGQSAHQGDPRVVLASLRTDIDMLDELLRREL